MQNILHVKPESSVVAPQNTQLLPLPHRNSDFGVSLKSQTPTPQWLTAELKHPCANPGYSSPSVHSL